MLWVPRSQRSGEFPQGAGFSAPHPHQGEKQKPNSPFSLIVGPTYLALVKNVGLPSMLGPIKQECRSQIKPGATEKTNLVEGLAQLVPRGELVKKNKRPGFLSPQSPLLFPSPKSIPQGTLGALRGPPPLPWRDGGRRLIRCLHPIYVLFVKASFQLQPGRWPLALRHAAQSYFTAPELVSRGQNVPIIILSLLPPL